MDRSRDWFRQAERELEQARWSMEGQFHELACFLSQQPAEKAVKAVCQARKVEVWGHMISRLLAQLSSVVTIPDEIGNAARNLDRHYIPTRYPNGFESGAPADYYTVEDAEEAIDRAEQVIRFCRRHLQ